MASDSTYATLQQAVVDIQKSITDKKSEIAGYQADPNYMYYKSRLSQTAGNEHQWIDASGVSWTGNDAWAQHRSAQQYVYDLESKLSTAQGVLTDLKNELVKAQKTVSDYQTNSPTVKAQILSDISNQAIQSGNQTLIVIGIFLFLATVSVIAIIRYRKNKKTQTT